MNSKIGVFVRSRPLNSQELRGNRCVSIARETVSIADKKYTFDQVFDDKSSQSAIYDRCVRELVDGCFEGFNATVFAYGQTGSGKTFTIMGQNSGQDEEEGIIPRALKQVFHTLSHQQSNRISNVRVSMLEIYNDECKDLLHIDIPSRDIAIREDKDGKIFFTGAREEVVSDFQSAMYFLEHGNVNRTTAETLMNQTSSRSHAIFTISIELLEYDGEGAKGSYTQAKLHLVDLAGSERAKRTGAQGSRLKESVGINQGLLSLGKVIRALTSAGVQHIPYRESKLTRFLQDSLGGNSQTVMLACISAAESNLHETLSTLQYASRAKTIQNKVVANVSEGVALVDGELESSMVAALKMQIVQMQSQIERINGGQQRGGGLPSIPEYGTLAAGFARPPPVPEGESGKALSRVLRIVAQIQESLQVTLRSLDASGAAASQCGPAWQLVVVSREAVRILQSIASQQQQLQLSQPAVVENSDVRLSMSLKNLRSSFAEGGGGGSEKLAASVLESEVEALRAELEECREDLKRDEDIFAEKIKELKKAKKQIKELEMKNKELAERGSGFAAEAAVLAKGRTPFTYVPMNADDKRALSVDAEDHKDHSELDDLDISIAVAATEPDISQLIEDLEATEREKEGLVLDSRRAEEKVERMSQSVKSQKMEFVKGQVQLKQQLMALENSIAGKEQTIAQLLESKDQTERVASAHSQRVQRLEQDREDLQAQLRAMDSLRSRNIEEFEEERQLKQMYERKLQSAQEQLAAMEERQKEERSRAAEQRQGEHRLAAAHLRDLEVFRAEHAKLQAQIDQAEAAQRRTLDAANKQMEDYRLQAADSSQRVQELEQRNADLLRRVEQLSKARESPPARAEGKLRTKNASGGAKGEVQSAAPSGGAEGMKHWLTQRINHINDAKVSAAELARVQDVVASLSAERAELLAELEPLERRKRDVEDKLSKKIDSLSAKMRTLKVAYFQLKSELAALRQLPRPTEEQRERAGDVEREMAEIEHSMGSYDEHREECVERLRQGGLDEAGQLRHAELREEADNLSTEIDLNRSLMDKERVRLAKIQQATQTTRVDGEAGSVMLVVPANMKGGGLANLGADEYASMLLSELKSNVQFSGVFDEDGSGSAALDDILLQLFQSVMAEKYRVTSLDEAARASRAQLDEKCAEYDELVKAMQRARSDFMRRQEQQRRENDDKVAFLLQQLRAAETRLAEQGSGGGEGGTAGARRSKGSPVRPSSSHSRKGEERKSSDSLDLTSPDGEKVTDSLLLEQSGEATLQHVQEIARRWLVEKKKRQRLEERNQDMGKELRLLRQAVSDMTATGGHLLGSKDHGTHETARPLSAARRK